jgi:hypothetical protein
MLLLFLVLGFSGIFEEENENEQEDEVTSGFFSFFGILCEAVAELEIV